MLTTLVSITGILVAEGAQSIQSGKLNLSDIGAKSIGMTLEIIFLLLSKKKSV